MFIQFVSATKTECGFADCKNRLKHVPSHHTTVVTDREQLAACNRLVQRTTSLGPEVFVRCSLAIIFVLPILLNRLEDAVLRFHS